MTDNYLVFKGLFSIWKEQNFNLHFYFQEIFPKALESISKDSISLTKKEDGEARYEALFVPVGFSAENIAMMSALFQPKHLRLAFTDASERFLRRYISLVKEKIVAEAKGIKITTVTSTSDDQGVIEQKIIEWVEDMRNIHGIKLHNIAIDLTGGTKPMSIGAHNAALSYEGIDAFYLKAQYDDHAGKNPVAIPGTERLIKLKKDASQTDPNLIFMIMPFSDEYNRIYEGIKPSIENATGKRIMRVDEEIFSGGIMDRIKTDILKSRLIVAELSEKNPNVYYELGLSHGHGKRVIMITQEMANIPFDLKHLRMVIYDKGNIPDLASKLIQEINTLAD